MHPGRLRTKTGDTTFYTSNEDLLACAIQCQIAHGAAALLFVTGGMWAIMNTCWVYYLL
jgi:hypothetical protein